MSAKDQKHDYHLVDPSPWPIYTSFATLITAIGTVYYFHSKGVRIVVYRLHFFEQKYHVKGTICVVRDLLKHCHAAVI